jgi:hypothetical protein
VEQIDNPRRNGAQTKDGPTGLELLVPLKQPANALGADRLRLGEIEQDAAFPVRSRQQGLQRFVDGVGRVTDDPLARQTDQARLNGAQANFHGRPTFRLCEMAQAKQSWPVARELAGVMGSTVSA